MSADMDLETNMHKHKKIRDALWNYNVHCWVTAHWIVSHTAGWVFKGSKMWKSRHEESLLASYSFCKKFNSVHASKFLDK